MQRQYADYGPFEPRRSGRWRLFRSVDLGAGGWAAVAGLCLAGAGAAGAASLLIGWPVLAGGAIGAVLTVVALVVADRTKWGRIPAGYSWDAPPETARTVAAQLQRQGLAVQATTHPDGRVALSYRQRDGRRVAVALSRLGIRPPGPW